MVSVTPIRKLLSYENKEKHNYLQNFKKAKMSSIVPQNMLQIRKAEREGNQRQATVRHPKEVKAWQHKLPSRHLYQIRCDSLILKLNHGKIQIGLLKREHSPQKKKIMKAKITVLMINRASSLTSALHSSP